MILSALCYHLKKMVHNFLLKGTLVLKRTENLCFRHIKLSSINQNSNDIYVDLLNMRIIFLELVHLAIMSPRGIGFNYIINVMHLQWRFDETNNAYILQIYISGDSSSPQFIFVRTMYIYNVYFRRMKYRNCNSPNFMKMNNHFMRHCPSKIYF